MNWSCLVSLLLMALSAALVVAGLWWLVEWVGPRQFVSGLAWAAGFGLIVAALARIGGK